MRRKLKVEARLPVRAKASRDRSTTAASASATNGTSAIAGAIVVIATARVRGRVMAKDTLMARVRAGASPRTAMASSSSRVKLRRSVRLAHPSRARAFWN
jgi:hypothetical protein